MKTYKHETKRKGKKLTRKIEVHLDYNERDALLIRLVEAMEEMAFASNKTLEILNKKIK